VGDAERQVHAPAGGQQLLQVQVGVHREVARPHEARVLVQLPEHVALAGVPDRTGEEVARIEVQVECGRGPGPLLGGAQTQVIDPNLAGGRASPPL
jgi:hypothetical protein